MDEYRSVLKLLKKNCPAKYPISVRRVKLGELLYGDCDCVKRKFYIRINKNLDQSMAIDTLLHEWAHALAWNRKKDYHWYGWGRTFSKVYRIYLKEYHNEK